MFNKLKEMKIKQRLNFGYKVVIIFMVLSGICSMIGLSSLFMSINSFVNGSNRADTAVKMCRIDVNIAARTIREMALNEDTSTYPAYRALVEEKVMDIGVELEALKETGLIDEALYQQYADSLTAWGAVGYEIMKKIESGDIEGAETQILTECTPALDEVVTISQQLDAQTTEMIDKSVKMSNTVFSVGIASVIIFIIIAIVMAVKLGKVIVQSISEPLSEIEAVAKELTEGNLHSTIDFRSTDEIGSLAHSLRKAIRILGTYVDDISLNMKEFAEGDFIIRQNVEWKGDFVEIYNNLKLFEESMTDTIKGIHTVADQVKNGSEQVSGSSMELAHGATEQAGITQELAATIETVSQQVLDNANNAKEISHKVDQAGIAIESSNNKMQEMVKAISEISDSSQEIGKIIATINDIASQTNLLALNASIEAARAGEAGRGFAVVADQVSTLAAQSAEAAKESTVLIEASVKSVEKGKMIADETARDLEEVMISARSVMKDVGSIAEALEAQTEAFEQINVGVEHINDVVQTNSATSEECAAASQEMNSQANALENLILKFKVAE